MDWDDLKLFLALLRTGTMRGAAQQSGVSHSTVARRIEQLEQKLGVKLLEKNGDGYALTTAGEEVFIAAEQVEQELVSVERRLAGRDQRLAGQIRVTMVDVLATHLLMPSLRQFHDIYPDIDIEVEMSYETLDLRKRDADIALRLTATPPDYLLGRPIGTVHHAGYATQAYLDQHDLSDPASANWIGFGAGERHPAWTAGTDFPHLPAKGVFDSILLQFHATLHGLGLGFLPCFVGDPHPELIRIDPPEHFAAYELWLLRHPDTRQTARLVAFSDFISTEVTRLAPLLEGRTNGG